MNKTQISFTYLSYLFLNNFKVITTLGILFVYPALITYAQSNTPSDSSLIHSLAFKDTTKSTKIPDEKNTLSFDSFAETQPKLLPDKMSFMERGLWGENGLVRKLGIASPLTPDVREHELKIRRFMLTAHQIGGFTTLGLMIAAAYFGQRVIDGHMNLGDTHQALVTATIFSYSLTGLLAILSPPPLIRRDEESTTTLHKTLAWIHVAGMVVTPILGSLIGGRRHFNIDKAHYHQIAGYITTAVFATSMIVVTF